MVDEFDLDEYADLFDKAEKKYNLPKGLLYRQAHQESKGDPFAESDAGAQGLMQFLPKTAASLKIDPFDPKQAIEGAGKLMRENLDRYGNVKDAVSAYHGGTDKKQWGAKTKDYVNQILSEKAGLPFVQVAEADTGIKSDAMPESKVKGSEKFRMMQELLNADDDIVASDNKPVSKFKLMEDALNGDDSINENEIAAVGAGKAQKAAIKQDKASISAAEDVVKSLPTGIVKGVNELPKLPGALYKFASEVGTQAGNKLNNMIHPESPYTEAQQAENIKNAGNDTVGNFLNSAPTINELTGGVIPKVAGLSAATIMNPLMGNNLTGSDLRETAKSSDFTGENALHQPQTKAGQVAENIAAAVPQGRVLGMGALPSVAGAAGAQAVEEVSPNNPIAQLVTGAVTGGAGKAVENRFSPKAAVNAEAPTISDNILNQAIKKDNRVHTDVETKLNALGDEAMLADAAGENTRGVAAALANMPGPAKEIAVKALEERHAGQADRIQQAALGNLKVDPDATYHSTVEELVTKRRTESKPLYEKAFEGGSVAPLEKQFEGDFPFPNPIMFSSPESRSFRI